MDVDGEADTVAEISYEEHGASTRGVARATFAAVCENLA